MSTISLKYCRTGRSAERFNSDSQEETVGVGRVANWTWFACILCAL